MVLSYLRIAYGTSTRLSPVRCRLGYDIVRGLGHAMQDPLPSLFSFKIKVSTGIGFALHAAMS
jgi:hypothetical protein